MARKTLSDENKVLGFFATAEMDQARKVMEGAQAIMSMRAPISRKPAAKKARAVKIADETAILK